MEAFVVLRYRWMWTSGLILLCLGFVLQILSLFVPSTVPKPTS
jgi:hypothetical protein